MTKFILLEYKDESRSGAQGKIAVWLFQEVDEARAKMIELAKNKLPLALYSAEPLLFFHPEEELQVNIRKTRQFFKEQDDRLGIR